MSSTLILKGVVSHFDKFKMYLRFVDEFPLSKQMLITRCLKTRVPFDEHFAGIKMPNKMTQKEFAEFDGHYVAVKVALKHYSFVSDGLPVDGTTLTIVDIKKITLEN